jgi:hypothetical protein
VAHLPVLALAQVVAHRVQLLRLALLLLLSAKAHLPVPAVRSGVVAQAVLVARRPVVAGLVVVPAVRRLNRQWFSAALARTTP